MVQKGINFNKIHWGSFTKQFKNRKNKNIKNLKSFSNYIIKHPNEFNSKTLKRANFYIHVIRHNKFKGGMIKGDIDEETIESQFPHFEDESIDPHFGIPHFATDEEMYNYFANDIFQHEFDPDEYGPVERELIIRGIKDRLKRDKDLISESESKISKKQDEENEDLDYSLAEQRKILNDFRTDMHKMQERVHNLKHKAPLHSNERNRLLKLETSIIDNNITGADIDEDILDEIERVNSIIEHVGNIKKEFYTISLNTLEELPEDIFNAGTITLKTLSISDKLSRAFLRQYFLDKGDDINSPEIKKEIEEYIAKPGNTFEFTSCGENNKLFSKICDVGDNNVVLSDFFIDFIFKECRDILLKDYPFTEEEIFFLKSGGSQFPQDLIDLLNLIVNERKDYNMDFLNDYNNEIKKMKEIYESNKSSFKNIKTFKKWYYKNRPYKGIDIQISKFDEPILKDWDDSKMANTKDEIKRAFSSNEPLYYTSFNSNKKIINWKKIMNWDEEKLIKIKNKMLSGKKLNKGETQEMIKKAFSDEMNKLIEKYLFDKNQEYEYIITSACSEGIVNYNYSKDKLFKKNILEVYKLKGFRGSTTKFSISIPITEFIPVQTNIKDTKIIAKQILERQLSTKQNLASDALSDRKNRLKMIIPLFIQNINDTDLLNVGTQKQKDKYKQYIDEANLDLHNLNTDTKFYPEAKRRNRYKDFYKNSKK